MSEDSPRGPVTFVDRLLRAQESQYFEAKRVGDVAKALVTIVALANTDGGFLVLGIDDEQRATGIDRLRGIEEKPEAVDELRRALISRITPPISDPAAPDFTEVPATLRDGTPGTVVLVSIPKSAVVHSIVDGGTYVRLSKSNRQLSAAEITELSMQRGVTSAVSFPVEVPFELLDTTYWRDYAEARGITRPLSEAMMHLGLAKKDREGALRPIRAAVLLFAEDPAGLLDAKCNIRVFHYLGDKVEHGEKPNLMRPPKTVCGPLIAQIRSALDAVLNELATGVQIGPLGFEIAQKYPVRVIREAITNAVIHRDYRLDADIRISMFANRIVVDSPGIFPGGVTIGNLGKIGSRPRNRAIVDHLREFSTPPNLDIGEGVPAMRSLMDRAELYPPLFMTGPDLQREAVAVYLFNQARPSTWGQVQHYLKDGGVIGNAEVRQILGTDDPVRASKLLKSWVDLGLLVPANPTAAKQKRRYRLPGTPEVALFSEPPGKQPRPGKT